MRNSQQHASLEFSLNSSDFHGMIQDTFTGQKEQLDKLSRDLFILQQYTISK